MPTEEQTPELIAPVPVTPDQGLVVPSDTETLPTVVVDDSPPVPLGRSWAFDMGSEQFIRTGSTTPRQTRGAATLLQWIDKCLHSQRGGLDIHPPEYGLEDPFAIYGRPISELSVQELERQFSDALTFHPRIAAVVNVELHTDPDSDAAYVGFQVQVDPPLDDADLLSARVVLENFT